MALLSDHDARAVRDQLSELTVPVTLLLFSQTTAPSGNASTVRRILNEVASLNDRVSVEEINVMLDRNRAATFGIEDIPAVAVLRDGEDTRIRFLGASGGYEFVSLIEAVMLAGRGDSGLTAESRALIARHVTVPVDIKVFATPTCPHCPRAVTLAHRMAVESPHITATCIEATEFLDLSRRFRVTGVPKTIADNGVEILGALPEDDFVRSLVVPDGDETTI